jgi:hypothetical protein
VTDRSDTSLIHSAPLASREQNSQTALDRLAAMVRTWHSLRVGQPEIFKVSRVYQEWSLSSCGYE